MGIRRPIALVACLLAGSGCAGSEAFVCTVDGDCTAAGAAGRCEPNGFCSFPDGTCPSAWRYGDHAGDGLGGTCVDEDGSTGNAGSLTVGDTLDPTTNDPAETSLTSNPTTTTTTATTSPPSECGNGIVEPGEECDGPAPGVPCTAAGFDSGELGCRPECVFDTAGCGECGNGVVDGLEVCDGFDVLDHTCESEGFISGDLLCALDCSALDPADCTNCGNGVLDDGELCDGMETAVDCAGLGLGDGTVGCTIDCEPDPMGCGPLSCGLDPDLSVGGCPAACTDCSENVCRIACEGSTACSDSDLVCPPGWACLVDCNGTNACSGANVTCPLFHACDVTCIGTSACSGLSLDCSPFGTCGLVCGDSTAICDGAEVECGADRCDVACGDAVVGVDCNQSCACTECAG